MNDFSLYIDLHNDLSGFTSELDCVRLHSKSLKAIVSDKLSRIITRALRMLFSQAYSATPDSGRAALFEEVVNRYDNTLSRLCFGYARTRSEYEDLRQDVLINIWQSLRNYRGESSLNTWIYRVTLNTCVSTLRKRLKELSTSQLDSIYDVIDESDSDRELLCELHRRIELLSPTDKAIILLWLDDFSYEDIAIMTGVGRNTLASRLRRAKDHLKVIREI